MVRRMLDYVADRLFDLEAPLDGIADREHLDDVLRGLIREEGQDFTTVLDTYTDHLALTDRLLDQRILVGALVHPLAEELVLRPDGNYYLRFLEEEGDVELREVMVIGARSGIGIGDEIIEPLPGS